jgi:CRISPR-associated protein GSU0054/csb2, Dpsyc system
MAAAICISTTFLTGRYHGKEWPPAPARLVQALVASAKTGANRTLWPQVEEGLRWLEQQPAPVILAKPVQQQTPYCLSVPNNDMDVVAKELAAGRSADPTKLRTMKTVRPRRIHPEEPHVRYIYRLRDGEDANAIAARLKPACHCLYSLGWGVDMAFADVTVEDDVVGEGYEEWSPSAKGRSLLRLPVPGFLDDLLATYERFCRRASGAGVDADTRPTVYRLQRYERQGQEELPAASFALRRLDGASVLSWDWHRGMEVAAWLRHACGQVLQEEQFGIDIESYVYGHTEGQPGERRERMSYLPLPSIGHQHADGRIRRAVIVEPANADGRVVNFLQARLSREVVTDEDGKAAAMLAPLEDDFVTSRYFAQAKVWRSVTPVVLHGHNATRGKISIQKTERLLLRAFEIGGVKTDLIETLMFQPAPLWAGTGGAKQIRVPAHLDGYPRYHVEVRFREPVKGPVFAGLGCHYGIGLFAAPLLSTYE